MTSSSNIDFLRWFDEGEREECGSCGERAAVGFPEVDAVFCLACASVWLQGQRLDVDRRIPV
jgi:hypothetical protein